MSFAADAVIALYERHARHWDGVRSRALFEKAWLDRFLACLPAGAAVLDIGCGAGEPVARYFVDAGCAVTGADSSAAMIALCRERMPNQHWVVSDMREMDLGRRFDGLVAWDSFFHLRREDQRVMFEVFARHAQPRATLMFTSGPTEGEAIGAYQGEPLYHASLDPQAYRGLLGANGFGVVAHVAEDADCGGRTIWLARRG